MDRRHRDAWQSNRHWREHVDRRRRATCHVDVSRRQNLSLALYLLGTDDESSRSRAGAGGFTIDYPNDRWDVSLSWKHIGDTLPAGARIRAPYRHPQDGSVRSPSSHDPSAGASGSSSSSSSPTYITNLQNRVENWRIFTAPFNTSDRIGRASRVELHSRSSNTSMHPSRSPRRCHSGRLVSVDAFPHRGRTPPRSVRGSSMRRGGGAVSMEGRGGSSSSASP